MSEEGNEWVTLNYQLGTFLNDVKLLAGNISSSGYSFEAIVAMTRGGLAPAAWLSQLLGVRKVYTVGGSFDYTGKFIVRAIPSSDIPDEKILLVSDLCRTGKTINQLMKEISLNCRSVKQMKLACLHYFVKSSVISPDFFVYKNTENDWVNYPWE